nr:aminoacyl-tRNA synthetase, class 1a, anticodon-binding [Tanacetum cinerariifolium]
AAIFEAERQELLEQELKQSLDAEQVYLDSLLAQRVAEEQERESRASVAQSTQRQAELDRIALNLTNEEWIGLVDQVRANLILSAELLGADVSEDTFSVRMVELMNQRQKAIADMKAKAKRDKPLTPAQQKEYMRAFVKNQSTAIYTTRAIDLATAKDRHQQLKRSGETLESLESKKLKSSHSTEQSTELREPTSVFAGATIAAGDPISAVPSISAATSIPIETPIAAGVSTTVGVSESASEIIPTEFGLGEIHVISRADGTVKRFSTLRELMHWVGRARLMVLYGMVSDKYKLERATGIDRDASIIWDDQDQWEIRSCRFFAFPAIHVLETKAGDIMYMFVDKKYLILPTIIQRMLNHGLEIDRDPSGNDLTTAI